MQPLLSIALWSSLAASTVALLVLMRTSWGRDRPTHRYVMVSVVAHLLLICVATTIRFVTSPAGNGPAPVKVRLVMRTPPPDAQPKTPVEEAPRMVTPPPEAVEQPAPQDPPVAEPSPTPPAAEAPLPAELVEAPPLPQPTEQLKQNPLEQAALTPPVETPPAQAPKVATPIDSQPAPEWSPIRPDDMAPLPQPTAQAMETVSLEPAPNAFMARDGQERLRRIIEEGGDSATEDAVAAALAWLAVAQSPDGRWDADGWSAGRERGKILGHDRTGVGAKADTAMTALALLTIMGAGHTHTEGPFAKSIHGGLAYLIRTQGADGNLFGSANLHAQTYCHSMATFALAEALAVSGDKRLEPPVRRAVEFLSARQDQRGGGWRYHHGAPGDTSQLGWILMALRSAELAGVAVPPQTWDGMERFLRSTQHGPNGGLASYLPNNPPSTSMTAESFYCRQILGRPIAGATAGEAVDTILGRLPGEGRSNYYAWYYATLALHHHRRASGSADNAWRVWNDALKRNLVAAQVSEGLNKGSWSPNTVWGGCGGRVYTTTMAAMCLEVYYRYDPNQLVRDPWIAAREHPGTLR